MKHILLIDDEPAVRFGIGKYLESEGFLVSEAACLREAREILNRHDFGAVLLDVRLPDGDGLEFLQEIRAADTTVPVILITGHGTIAMAVEAMRHGADQFLTKPVDLRELEVFLTKSMQIGSLRKENRALKEKPPVLQPYLGESAAMRQIFPLLEAAYRHKTPVLLQGETGTGKGLMARLIHERGTEQTGPFVELNCAGLKGELLESELFGHAKGAFTGAVQAKEGLLERAHKGTLFLDEIGDMDVTVQSKFLKVLEEKRFRPLGRVDERVSDFRLISATHQDLQKFIEDKQFRQDLYFRINTLTIVLPPLRDRMEDLENVVDHMFRFITSRRESPDLPPEIVDLLRAYHWPGNLRELHNVIERAWILSDGGKFSREHFAGLLPGGHGQAQGTATASTMDLHSAERQHIIQVLGRTNGNVPEAAKILGVSRATLYRKISQHHIELDKSR
jgi:DNA-binding NtrC family response regulator